MESRKFAIDRQEHSLQNTINNVGAYFRRSQTERREKIERKREERGTLFSFVAETILLRQNVAISSETTAAFSLGVHTGIIDPKKYSLESFKRDEINFFKDLYKEYISLTRSQAVDYQKWLIMNNFGILSDIQESLLERKTVLLLTATALFNKPSFVNTVKKGDILITGRGVSGLIGHAAIMTTDYWVLEMPGGAGWTSGIKSNNRQIGVDKWLDEHNTFWTRVYRCPDAAAASEAATWADHTYYNPNGGMEKEKHITYLITPNILETNPSYCSKLVIQAYYFGTGKKQVVKDLSNININMIVPSILPSYFLSPYKLTCLGKF